MLPTFLVIGAMKCGTTSLYYYLAEHPEIGMSRRKETDFFLGEHGNWARGRPWYAQQFPEDSSVRGECSPNYTKRHLFDRVPERIASVCPDVKLIYLVRDPVERTLSHYHGSCLQGREDRTLDAAVAGGKQSNYVRTSCYHWQLHPYLNRFSAEDLLVLSTERLGAAPEATLRAVYRFLGVDPEVQSSRAGQRFNASSEKKRQDPWVRWLSEQVPQPLKDSLRPYLPLHWLPGERVPRPTPAPEVRAHLEGILHPEAESLRALTGRDFEEWSV